MSPARDERCGLTLVSGGLDRKTYDHEPEPKPGTIYSVGGPNTGRVGNPRHWQDYPLEAFCLHCPEMISVGQTLPIGAVGTWQHTGRLPGQS